MNTQLGLVGAGVAVSVIGLVSGLLGAYAGLHNRAFLAEVRTKTAETENRLVMRINGTYVRTTECQLRRDASYARVDASRRRAESNGLPG
jgi:hypothetical protein